MGTDVACYVRTGLDIKENAKKKPAKSQINPIERMGL